MKLDNKHSAINTTQEASFDELMANLFVLITHHSLTQCQKAIPIIVERLEILCRHSEIEYYPHQLTVLAKMHRLWRTQLFKLQTEKIVH